MKSTDRIRVFTLLALCAAVAGCGKGDGKSPATQVAAKVNSSEITIYQVNNVLAKTPNLTPASEPRVKQVILDNLIDQQLARQKALGAKLDRTPAVMQALESAKTEILARAYVEQIAAAQPKPTPDEIAKYYAAHPELFAQRRVFSIEEISLPVQEGLADRLREQLAKAHSLVELAAWLKSQNIQYAAHNGVRAAEQLPIEYLPQVQTMKDGESRVFDLRTGPEILRVVASKPAPLDEAAATPQIRQFLSNKRVAEAVAADMKQLKQAAKIEYAGEFAHSVAENEAAAKALAETSAKAEAEAKSVADAQAKSRADARATAAQEDEARADALAKARAVAEQDRREAEARQAAKKTAQLPQQSIEKGVRGLN